jgi:hypothetical protein
MPVSLFPLIFPLLLIVVPLLFLLKSPKAFLVAAAISGGLLTALFLWVYVPGWILMARANGDPAAMYELARWTEKHDNQIGEFILWPLSPDQMGGYDWLRKAAALDSPPAVYAVGVRLKYGIGVPRPPGWDGPEVNFFPQPKRGQALIDRAIGLGYQPVVDEESFYLKQYLK